MAVTSSWLASSISPFLSPCSQRVSGPNGLPLSSLDRCLGNSPRILYWVRRTDGGLTTYTHTHESKRQEEEEEEGEEEDGWLVGRSVVWPSGSRKKNALTLTLLQIEEEKERNRRRRRQLTSKTNNQYCMHRRERERKALLSFPLPLSPYPSLVCS